MVIVFHLKTGGVRVDQSQGPPEAPPSTASGHRNLRFNECDRDGVWSFHVVRWVACGGDRHGSFLLIFHWACTCSYDLIKCAFDLKITSFEPWSIFEARFRWGWGQAWNDLKPPFDSPAGQSMASWRHCGGAPKTQVQPRGKRLDQHTTRQPSTPSVHEDSGSEPPWAPSYCNGNPMCQSDCQFWGRSWLQVIRVSPCSTYDTYVELCWYLCYSMFHPCFGLDPQHFDPDFLMTLPPIAIAGNGPSREEDPTIVFQRATSRRIQNAHQNVLAWLNIWAFQSKFWQRLGVVFDCRDWWTFDLLIFFHLFWM